MTNNANFLIHEKPMEKLSLTTENCSSVKPVDTAATIFGGHFFRIYITGLRAAYPSVCTAIKANPFFRHGFMRISEVSTMQPTRNPLPFSNICPE